jgi:hypothetical protein
MKENGRMSSFKFQYKISHAKIFLLIVALVAGEEFHEVLYQLHETKFQNSN